MGADSVRPNDRNLEAQDVYLIRIKGVLDERWSDCFNGMAITCERGGDGSPITTLTGGVADQPRLRGLLSRLWDLNLTLISITHIEPKDWDLD